MESDDVSYDEVTLWQCAEVEMGSNDASHEEVTPGRHEQVKTRSSAAFY